MKSTKRRSGTFRIFKNNFLICKCIVSESNSNLNYIYNLYIIVVIFCTYQTAGWTFFHRCKADQPTILPQYPLLYLSLNSICYDHIKMCAKVLPLFVTMVDMPTQTIVCNVNAHRRLEAFHYRNLYKIEPWLNLGPNCAHIEQSESIN